MKVIPTILACLLILVLAAGAILLLFVFQSVPVRKDPVVEPRVVNSMVARRIDKRIDIETQGTVTSRSEIDLVCQVSGVVKSISKSLENGEFFAADDILVQIEDRDYDLEVTRAKALVAQAELRVNLEEAEAELAKREWESVGEGEASPLTLREPQVKEAKAGLASAKAALGIAELALKRTQIRAPFAGRVRKKSVDAGQFVSQGTPLARIYSVDAAEIRLPLHDRDLRYLKIPLSFPEQNEKPTGPTTVLRTRFAQRDLEWTGVIVRTEGEVDAKSRMVHAIARVEDPYGRKSRRHGAPLAVGMFVHATIHGRTFENVVEVPRDAVRQGGGVLVIDNEDRLRHREIEVLYRSPTTVVVSKGIEDGERICLSPIGVFVEGMKVRISQPEAESK